MSNDTQLLSARVHLLGELLGDVITRLSGRDTFERVERVRQLAKANRSGDPTAAGELSALVQGLNAGEAYELAMAFTTYFELVNLAEEDHRTRILRTRRAARAEAMAANPAGPAGAPVVRESIEAALIELKHRGVSPEQLQAQLDSLWIELVFTAHPTESKRRTILSKLRRIGATLRDFEALGATAATSAIGREIVALWLTDRTRASQPAVTDEARTGLFFFSATLWDVIPRLYGDLREALSAHYPTVTAPPRWLSFGSWIGGDRDGNPNVTAAVTADTLHMHRRLALERLRDQSHELSRALSVSRRRDDISDALKTLIERSVRATSTARNTIDRYPNEPYRAVLSGMAEQLNDAWQKTLSHPIHPAGKAAPAEAITEADVRSTLGTIADSLGRGRAAALAEGDLGTLRAQSAVFGTHVSRLDLRQHSDWHQAAVSDIIGTLAGLTGLPSRAGDREYAELDENDKLDVLTRALAHARPIALERFGVFRPETMNVVEPLMVAREAIARYGPSTVGNYVISMTDNVSDVLEVLLLMTWCGVRMDIAPLFETLDDLNRAPDVLGGMFGHPAYRRHLAERGEHQVIMLGYSDSNKDCGYITANWALFRAQETITRACSAAGVAFTLFHGRGGSIARGGGPAAKAILAQPHGLVHGRIRITEQGEVLSTRYLNPDVAHRHLEQVAYGVLLAADQAKRHATVPPEWREAMDRMADVGHRAYSRVVDGDPGLIEFWRQATPIDEIGSLKIASRPAFRRATRTVADLRAIPWVFSWMQSRFNFPGWYGLGTALAGELDSGPEARDRLRRMYTDWPFFQAIIDNAQQSLTKADMHIARVYSELVPDAALRERVMGILQAEYDLTTRTILDVTGQASLLDNEKALQRSIQLRNPYVDPLNYVQVEMIRRLRGGELSGEERERARAVIDLTINGLSSGLRNTG